MKRSKLALVSLMVVIGCALKYSNVLQYLSLTWLHAHVHQLHELVSLHYWYSIAVYCATYIGVCVLGLPGTTACMVAGGMLFGIIPGIILINVSATLGATLLFLISRFVIGTSLQHRYASQLQTLNSELEYYGHYYILILRIIGIIPFGLLNILAGMTTIDLTTFMWATSCGIIPLSLLSVYTGYELSNALAINDMWTFPVVCATGIFLFVRIGLVPVLVQFIRRRRMYYSIVTKS